MNPIYVAPDEDRNHNTVEALLKLNQPAKALHIPVDYAWQGEIPVMGERKTPDDLIASANDGRLAKQIDAMQESYGFILLEGQWSFDGGWTVGRWTWDQFMNLLQSIQSKGVKIDLSPNKEMTPRRLVALYKWSQKEEHDSWRRPLVAMPPAEDYLDRDYRGKIGMLMHLPDCGEKKANVLMESFGLMGTLGITEEGLTEASGRWATIKGIGPKLTKKWEEWIRG
jgi:ERCC4-type nuclease